MASMANQTLPTTITQKITMPKNWSSTESNYASV